MGLERAGGEERQADRWTELWGWKELVARRDRQTEGQSCGCGVGKIGRKKDRTAEEEMQKTEGYSNGDERRADRRTVLQRRRAVEEERRVRRHRQSDGKSCRGGDTARRSQQDCRSFSVRQESRKTKM